MSKLKYVNMNETLNCHMHEITYGNWYDNGTESNKHDAHVKNVPYGSMYENYGMNVIKYNVNIVNEQNDNSENVAGNEYVSEIAYGTLNEIVTVNEKMNNTENTNKEYDYMNGHVNETANNDKNNNTTDNSNNNNDNNDNNNVECSTQQNNFDHNVELAFNNRKRKKIPTKRDQKWTPEMVRYNDDDDDNDDVDDSPYHVHDYSNFSKLLKMRCCSYDTATIKAIIYYLF